MCVLMRPLCPSKKASPGLRMKVECVCVEAGQGEKDQCVCVANRWETFRNEMMHFNKVQWISSTFLRRQTTAAERGMMKIYHCFVRD